MMTQRQLSKNRLQKATTEATGITSGAMNDILSMSAQYLALFSADAIRKDSTRLAGIKMAINLSVLPQPVRKLLLFSRTQ